MDQLNERLGQFIAAREIDRQPPRRARVARSLAALFHPVLYPGVGELLRITQQELAYLVGCRASGSTNALIALQAAGLIRIEYGGVRVLDLAGQLIGEDSGTEKEYLVRVTWAGPQGEVATNVDKVFPPAQLARLRHGLSLDGQPLKRAQVDWQNPEQLRFVLTEGKKRQIRRMCEQVGLKVVGLKRIRIGRVVLGQLPVGQWRYLGLTERF
jgi:23S rRNA pseudouridine2604 synthase